MGQTRNRRHLAAAAASLGTLLIGGSMATGCQRSSGSATEQEGPPGGPSGSQFSLFASPRAWGSSPARLTIRANGTYEGQLPTISGTVPVAVRGSWRASGIKATFTLDDEPARRTFSPLSGTGETPPRDNCDGLLSLSSPGLPGGAVRLSIYCGK